MTGSFQHVNKHVENSHYSRLFENGDFQPKMT